MFLKKVHVHRINLKRFYFYLRFRQFETRWWLECKHKRNRHLTLAVELRLSLLLMSIVFFTPLMSHISPLKPFTLGVPPESIVCYSHTFEINLGMKQNFTKYLMESCCLASDFNFSFNYFPKNAFV